MKFPHGNFDSDQLAILQKAFDGACAELGVSEDDSDGRDRIAHALMALAKVGQYDPERLMIYAVSRYKSV